MKTFEFKQHQVKKAFFIGIPYLIVVFLICYFLFGGINGMVDKVNNMGSFRGAFVIGAVILIPLFLIQRIAHPKIRVDIDSEKITVKQKGKTDLHILLNSIGKIDMNISVINRINMYNKEGQLITFFHDTNNSETAKLIFNEIERNSNFDCTSGSKIFFNTTIETKVCLEK
ncbi:hypothetical protein CMT92_12935 [Elizabethkingia anophelis]|uniref:hypothetical protein n=1 Tax=Elizabethkingia anophelis TaxID=1117645 RepID=UPI0021A87391|nr:hypothetical protein [Elizabethkingia anophelis]MCT3874690.1 hypothetical protein [Elizabethkingia anophelis]MDV3848553.1 hypothetical protein [Elizabethkingia anophelis]